MAEFDEKLNSLLSDPGAMSQIMQLAQSLSGGAEQSVPPQGQPPSPPPAPKSPDLLSALTGGADPALLTRLLPLIQELGNQNSNARQLLYALRPYLRPERQEKVERAKRQRILFPHPGRGTQPALRRDGSPSPATSATTWAGESAAKTRESRRESWQSRADRRRPDRDPTAHFGSIPSGSCGYRGYAAPGDAVFPFSGKRG